MRTNQLKKYDQAHSEEKAEKQKQYRNKGSTPCQYFDDEEEFLSRPSEYDGLDPEDVLFLENGSDLSDSESECQLLELFTKFRI